MTSSVVVTDLDGTLWDADVRCHPTTFGALAELERRGVAVLAATGRRPNSALAGFDNNDLTLPAVLLNGALGIDFATGDRFHQHAYETHEARSVLDSFAAHDLTPCVYTADGLVQTTRNPSTSSRRLDALGADQRSHDSITHIADTHAVLGMSILGATRESLAGAAELIDAQGHGEVAFYPDHLYGCWSLMVQPSGISKWQGIEAWLAQLDTKPGPVIAIGDGGNDIEMLQNADVSVAIEGSHADQSGVADHQLPAPEDGGWAQLLQLVPW